MRKAVLAGTFVAVACLSSSVFAQQTSSCPPIDAEIRACEANNMRYETYIDAQQCKRATCVQPGVQCPTDAQMQEQALGCQTQGKTAEKFWNGYCTVMRCVDSSVCPTERESSEAIAACKAAGQEYRYFQRGNCNVVECDATTACPSNSKLEQSIGQCQARGMQYRYVHDGRCRRVECIDSQCQEEPGFRTAEWRCQDGFTQKQGDPSSCKPSETWRRYAEDACKGRCNRETGKCGIADYSVDWECGGTTACATPSQTCPSMEENERIIRECSSKGGNPAKAWDNKNCLRISCDHAEALAREGEECLVLRKKIDAACTDKSVLQPACTDAREAFAEQCLHAPDASRCLDIFGGADASGDCGNGTDADAQAVADWCFGLSDVLDKAYADTEYSDVEKAQFYVYCYSGNNFRAESDTCKDDRAKLVKMMNAGLTTTKEFATFSRSLADQCRGTDTAALPAAAHDDEVLTDDQCLLYDNPYPDTAQCSLQGKAATELYRRDIATGMPSGEFDGDAPLNRAQAAKFLLRACNLDEALSSNRIAPDIDVSQWYATILQAAMAHDVVRGDPSGTVRPNAIVNRAEFSTMLMRACAIEPQGWYVCYDDVGSDAWYAQGAAVAERYDLYPGANSLFRADAPQTRAETAVAIYQYLKNRDAAPKPSSDSSCFALPVPSASTDTDADAQFGVGIE